VITATIVVGSLLLAGVYAAAWLLAPGLRRQIESPKHWFAAQTRQYDRACHEQRKSNE
jgi:hypothetical protein